MKNMSQSRPGKKNGMYGIRRRGKTNPFYGHKHTDETKLKISQSKKGVITNEKHPAWKGDMASYDAIHMWVRRNKGNANICEFCGITRLEKMVHWANKNHLYKRILDDYISLCVKCHWEYDKKHNNKHSGVNKKDLFNFRKL